MPTTALTLARRLFRSPRPTGRVRPTAKLSVTQLEARDVPAFYQVSLAADESGAGTKGDAGA